MTVEHLLIHDGLTLLDVGKEVELGCGAEEEEEVQQEDRTDRFRPGRRDGSVEHEETL